MSRATKMKVVAAMKLIESIGFDDGVESEVFAELLKRNTRANGSVNVSALHREAIALADSYFADQILGSVSRETDD
jgi:hypothetical protein